MRSIREAGAALRAGEISCVELVQEALRAEAEHQDLNCFITLTNEEALEEARKLDGEFAHGRDRGPLHGIPIAHKDLFFTKGVHTTNGSKVFADFVPNTDAAVVSKLREAGAISLGKLNMHEMAYGITSNNPHYGPVRNPHGKDRIPGGSSGGSGAAVAAGIVFAATGSDTGGSIRIPAAYCGCVGFKPTFGIVSTEGCFPLDETLDHMGPLTRTVEDAGILFGAMSDRTIELKPNENVRVGIPDDEFFRKLSPEVESAMQRVKGTPVRVPDPQLLFAAARTILLVHASKWLLKIANPDDLGADIRTMFESGAKIPASEYADARVAAETQKQQWAAVFQEIDVLLMPTIPITAPPIGATTVNFHGEELDTRLLTTRFCRGINLLGYPAISIPFTTDSMPVGLQIVGGWSQDEVVLNYAATLRV